LVLLLTYLSVAGLRGLSKQGAPQLCGGYANNPTVGYEDPAARQTDPPCPP